MLEKSGVEKCFTSREVVEKSVRGVVGQECCREVLYWYKSIRGLVDACCKEVLFRRHVVEKSAAVDLDVL